MSSFIVNNRRKIFVPDGSSLRCSNVPLAYAELPRFQVDDYSLDLRTKWRKQMKKRNVVDIIFSPFHILRRCDKRHFFNLRRCTDRYILRNR